jgi:hypothetical protein
VPVCRESGGHRIFRGCRGDCRLDTLPDAAVNVAAMYCALARDISSGGHTAPDYEHAVRLTHLLDDVLQSANTGHRRTQQDWPASDR